MKDQPGQTLKFLLVAKNLAAVWLKKRDGTDITGAKEVRQSGRRRGHGRGDGRRRDFARV